MALTVWCPKGSYALLKDIAGDLKLPCTVSAKPVDPSRKDLLPWMDSDGVILLLGGALAENIKQLGLTKKNATLASMRERMYAYPLTSDQWAHLMVSYDPIVTEQSSERRVDLLWDLQLAARLASTGSLEPVVGQYRWVETFDDLEWQVANAPWPTHVERLSLDLETLGLDPFAPEGRILTVSLTHEEGRSDVYRVPPDGRPPKALIEQLRRLLCGAVRIQGANLKFDLLWLAVHWGIEGVNQTFDTHLVGSLLDENRSNSLETHAKIYTTMGGYDCVAPETRVLTRALRWTEAGSLGVGDELVGFDEHPVNGKGSRRRMRVATVLASGRVRKPCLRVGLSTGATVVCSEDHLFVSRPRSVERGGWRWMRACELSLGHEIQTAVPLVQPPNTFPAGWMSGFLDGEGYVSKNHRPGREDRGFILGWSQKPGAVHETACSIFDAFGVTEGLEPASRNGGTNKDVLTVKVGHWSAWKALLTFRPERLIAKRPWEGAPLPTHAEHASVISLETVGVRDVVALKTSTATFIAEGLCSHNSAFNRAHDKGRMDLALDADPDGFLTYAGGDTDACHRVASAQRRLLTQDKRLTRFYTRILQPASRVFAKIEQRGVVVDRERYKELEAQCRADLEEQASAAFKHMPRRLILKYADNLSLTRPELIREFMFTKRGLNLEPELFTEKGEKPATSSEHLNRFADHPVAGPFVRAMEKYNATNKTLTTYIVGFQRFIRADGRFHPTYRLGRGSSADDPESGTVTGRLSATEPAYQCQPAWARVLTRDGYRTMAEIIEALERAQPVEVLAHDGSWRRAHTPYRNGPQPVYRLTLEDGKGLDCTGNHPVLTDRGWVEVQYLNAQDRVRVHDAELPEPSRAVLRAADRRGTRRVVFAREVALRVPVWARARGGRGQSDQWQHHELRLPLGRRQAQAWPSLCLAGGPTGHVAHVPSVGQHEGAVRQPDANQLSVLRWARDHVLRPLAKLPAILGGHGRVPSGPDAGAHRCGWALRAGQLHMDSTGRAEPQQAQFAWAAIRRLEVLTGSPETFGIAVEGTHSYVSEGIVNHNTIPKRTAWAKPLRSVYPCPPGHGILKLDFNQGELRIMACLADDPTMIDAYRHNKDLHTLTAAATMGLTPEQFSSTLDEWIREEKRRAAKAINFGLLYGMMPPGLVDYARKSYGVEMSLDQAGHYWQTFFQTYARLPKYHEKMKREARKNRSVRNPLGRVRHLPLITSPEQSVRSLAERQAINSPIQSCLSDMMLLAMVELDRALPDLWIFGMTHDSVELYVPLESGLQLAAEAKATMENLPLSQFGWNPQITFRADPEYTESGTLADVKKLELAA